MSRASLIITLVFFSLTCQSQKYDSWKIFHNRKELASFNNKKESADERRVVLLNRSIDDPGFFIIEFKPAGEEKEWIRTIAFLDSNDRIIKEYNNTLFLRIHNTEMGNIAGGKQKIKVYSWAVPKDPAAAAAVRVRRILLCTLYTR